jgi:rod shape determining protein RodA
LAEELGFMGALVLLALFGLLLWRLLRIAERSRNQFGLLVGAGLFSWLFSQMLVNIGINLGLLPVTGITLPLVSYGGSSILAVMIGLGLGQSVADQSQRGKVIEIR